MTGDLFAGGKRGQGVDEAKEVGLEGGVAHGPVKHEALPVSRLEDIRLFAFEPLEQVVTEALDVVFEENVARIGHLWQLRGEIHAGS